MARPSWRYLGLGSCVFRLKVRYQIFAILRGFDQPGPNRPVDESKRRNLRGSAGQQERAR